MIAIRPFDPSSFILHPSSFILHPSSFFPMDSQLVVLGGGPGGYAAAFLAADLGMQVTLVERGIASGRHLPAPRLHPLEGPAARRQGDVRGRAPGRVGRLLPQAGHRPGRHAGTQGKGHRHAQRRAEADRGETQREARSGQGPVRRWADAAAASGRRRAAGRRPRALRELHPGQRFAARADTSLRSADTAGNGLDRSLGTGRRARVVAGGGRRLHRPGNGDGLRGAGHARQRRRVDRRPVARRRPRSGPSAAQEAGQGFRRDSAGREGRLAGQKRARRWK